MKSNDIILMYLLTRMVSVFPSNSTLPASLGLLDTDVVGCTTYKIASVLIGEFSFTEDLHSYVEKS